MSEHSLRPITSETSAGTPILVTGAAGFIGVRVVDLLLQRGFTNVRCAVRASSDLTSLEQTLAAHPAQTAQIVNGNLLSMEDCRRLVGGVEVIYHLATGRGKSFAGVFQNCAVATRNLVEASREGTSLRRFVNVSTFAVHSNLNLPRHSLLDEEAPLEDNLKDRYDAYVYAKLRQDELIERSWKESGFPAVTVRPSVVFGPGRTGLPNPVGIGTFGIFLRIAGGNRLPLTYVDNCAEAIVLAGLKPGVEGQTFIIVDDDLPKCRKIFREYRRRVSRIRYLPVSYGVFSLFCRAWERYAHWSQGQLPPVFNRRFAAFNWKPHQFSNTKIKEGLGWKPTVPMHEALEHYFKYQEASQEQS